MNTITAQNIIYQETLTLKSQAVFSYLADRSNKDNICWPGLKKIAADCKISLSTVQRAIKELLTVGLLMKKNNFRPNGSQTSNIYFLTENVQHKEKIRKENKRQQLKLESKRKREEKEQQLSIPEEIAAIDSNVGEQGIESNRQTNKETVDDWEKTERKSNSLLYHVIKLFQSHYLNRGGSQNEYPKNLNKLTYLPKNKKINIAKRKNIVY